METTKYTPDEVSIRVESFDTYIINTGRGAYKLHPLGQQNGEETTNNFLALIARAPEMAAEIERLQKILSDDLKFACWQGDEITRLRALLKRAGEVMRKRLKEFCPSGIPISELGKEWAKAIADIEKEG